MGSHNDIAHKINLEAAIGDSSDLGVLGVASVGSAWHHLGLCKPCDFVTRGSCRRGAACEYCHLCGKDANKRCRKERKQRLRASASFHTTLRTQFSISAQTCPCFVPH